MWRSRAIIPRELWQLKHWYMYIRSYGGGNPSLELPDCPKPKTHQWPFVLLDSIDLWVDGIRHLTNVTSIYSPNSSSSQSTPAGGKWLSISYWVLIISRYSNSHSRGNSLRASIVCCLVRSCPLINNCFMCRMTGSACLRAWFPLQRKIALMSSSWIWSLGKFRVSFSNTSANVVWIQFPRPPLFFTKSIGQMSCWRAFSRTNLFSCPSANILWLASDIAGLYPGCNWLMRLEMTTTMNESFDTLTYAGSIPWWANVEALNGKR